MRVVYLAEQETPVRRHVALKVIKLGMDNRAAMAWFVMLLRNAESEPNNFSETWPKHPAHVALKEED